MSTRQARVVLDVGPGVCDCPGGRAPWVLTQGWDAATTACRRAACLTCGRAWEKRLAQTTAGLTEDAWRAARALEVE